MVNTHVVFSAKRAYASCIIGLVLAEFLLYAIISTIYFDPISKKPELFIFMGAFAACLAILIKWFSGQFTCSVIDSEIESVSPLPWAKKRTIKPQGARPALKEDAVDCLLGTASISVSIGKKTEIIGPFEKKDARFLENEIRKHEKKHGSGA